MTIPESADGLNSISVDKETHVHYKLSHLLLNKKALSFSEDTQLKVDDQGTMSLMHMVRSLFTAIQWEEIVIFSDSISATNLRVGSGVDVEFAPSADSWV